MLVKDSKFIISAARAEQWPDDDLPEIVFSGKSNVGKSSLISSLISVVRSKGKTVGVISVDPSSPFSGGAILADRIRMQRHTGDPGVYIRSMGTRGSLGGLSRGAKESLILLDACGYDVIIIETVGVGQDEVDVVSSVDTVLVVAVPGLGDDIQAIKAGILEIADVFVLNKADREGADRVAHDLEIMLSLGHHGHHGPAVHRGFHEAAPDDPTGHHEPLAGDMGEQL